MANTYNTGNAIGSADPRDAYDNASNFDEFINSSSQGFTDRRGVSRKTITGATAGYAAFNVTGAWTTATAYNVNDIWSDSGTFYLVLADYTSGASAAADIAGGNVVVHQPKDWVVSVATIADLRALEPAFEGQQVELSGHTVAGIGGGMFYADYSSTAADDNGVTVITAGGRRWVRSVSGRLDAAMFGADNSGSSDSSAAFQSLLSTIPNGETRHFNIIAGSYLLNSSPSLPAGANVVWHVSAGATIAGTGSLPEEFNSIREVSYGLAIGGEIYLGKNAGAPGNADANGGVTLGGYTDRLTDQDRDGMRVEGEGSNAHNAVTYCTRKAGQSQWNHQCIPVFGTCNVSGTTVTRVSGTDFSGIEAAKTITINRVEYEILRIDSADQITLMSSAGTQSGVKYRIATVYAKVLCDISGTTLNRVAGEVFVYPISAVFIDGVRYAATYVDQDTMTLGSAPGDATDKIVYGVQGDTAVVVQRLQVQPGANEQSMTWGFREDKGYFLQSIVTGGGEHRQFNIGTGLFGDNIRTFPDGAVEVPYSLRVFGTPIIAPSTMTLGRFGTGHPLRPENNISVISHDRPGQANGGLSFDMYVDTVYDKTPLYIDISGNWLPGVDNAYNVGSASNRMKNIYAGTGSINTSDRDAKTEIRDIEDAEKNVAKELKCLIKAFKFKDAVEEKGSEARIHFGVVAQEVGDVFKKHGLDPNAYALFCYDEWDEEVAEWPDQYVFDEENQDYVLTKKAGRRVTPGGSRYGIRYEELLAFIIGTL